jgi:hypothetical protein
LEENMKKKIIHIWIFIAVILLPLSAFAGDFDGSRTLLCSLNNAMECTVEAGCKQVTPDSIAAPDFLKIEFKKKIISGISEGTSGRTTTIENSEFIDGKLILQGAEDGVEGVRDGLGWSMAIMEDSGRMVLTGSGNDVGFVIFGACTTI